MIGIGVNVDTPHDELAPELSETATSLRIETGQRIRVDGTRGFVLILSAQASDEKGGGVPS